MHACGSKIYQNPFAGNPEAAVAHGAPDPFLGFPDRSIGQAYDIESGKAFPQIGFHRNAIPCETFAHETMDTHANSSVT
jgi:hypothetical protein